MLSFLGRAHRASRNIFLHAKNEMFDLSDMSDSGGTPGQCWVHKYPAKPHKYGELHATAAKESPRSDVCFPHLQVAITEEDY